MRRAKAAEAYAARVAENEATFAQRHMSQDQERLIPPIVIGVKTEDSNGQTFGDVLHRVTVNTQPQGFESRSLLTAKLRELADFIEQTSEPAHRVESAEVFVLLRHRRTT